MSIETLRNIGIIAHVDAGKTTTSERILYYAGAKHKMGDVDTGNTTTDFDPEEAARGITIYSAAVTVSWRDHQINIIDTPGHVDFTAEVERSLRVLDGGVVVFCAVGGVEVQSETVWFQANKYNVPRIAYVNKLDRTGADFYNAVKEMEEKLQANVALCSIPAGQGPANFEGIIDVIRMKMIWKDPADTKHWKLEYRDIPALYQQEAHDAREKLLNAVSMHDDHIAGLMLEGKPISEAELRQAIRKSTLAMHITPVLCGSSFKYQGIQNLLDCVVDFMPSPADRGSVQGLLHGKKEHVERKPLESEPMSALAFKTVAEPTGDVVYTRVYSGKLEPGTTYLNSTKDRSERISHVYRMFGKDRERLEYAGPGEIVGLVGLKETQTGNTLTTDDKNAVVLEEIRFPEPVISQALEPTKNTDEGKLSEAIAKMVRDDPTLKCKTDHETNQIILSGMGELHLEIAVHKLKRDFKVEVGIGKPMVSYRQTLAKPIEQEYKHVKQTGGRGQFARIFCRFEPLSKEEREQIEEELLENGEKPDPNGLYFIDEIVGGVVPNQYIPAVEKGFRIAAHRGTKFKFQFVDIKCTLFDGKHHDVDSSQIAFQVAAEQCFKEATQNAGIVLLEPIMEVNVQAPGQYIGELTGDTSRRRGEILNSSLDKGRAQLHAYIPLASLFGYSSELRNFTSGTASFVMEPSHYAPVKEELADIRADMRKAG